VVLARVIHAQGSASRREANPDRAAKPFAKRKMGSVKKRGKVDVGSRRVHLMRFSEKILAILREGKHLRIRAGGGEHRFIGIWVVVVKDRAFVRSWSLKPKGWYRTFLKDPRGAIRLAEQEVPIRAVRIRSKALMDAIDLAYLEKYSTPGSLKYAKDLGSAKSRATTIELVPANA